MPDTAVLGDLTDTDAEVEPKDKRTGEWKAWRARHPSATATVEVAPVTAIPEAPARIGKIMPPDDFLILFLTNNPAGVAEYSQYTNAAAQIATAALKAYEGYLLCISPAYRKHYVSLNTDPNTRQILPDPNALWNAYDAAMAK